MRKLLPVLVLLTTVATAAPATAMRVTHEKDSYSGSASWSCPGKNPQEDYTVTSRSTTFRRDGVRTRIISHQHWRGWITSRQDGALVRDDGDWTVVNTFGPNGNRVIRSVTTGSVWRLTVPGDGIVVHQAGRSWYNPASGDSGSSAAGGFADPSDMCDYV